MKPLLLDEVKIALRAELKTPLGRGLITGVTTDSRQVKTGDLFIALRGDRYDGHDFVDEAVRAGARALVIERNMPLSDEIKNNDVCVMKVADTVGALGDLARFYRRTLGHRLNVIAVTGSNGKTTTREMIYHVLSKRWKGHRSPKNYNNQLGVPLTILGIEPEHDFVVIELGSSSPGEIKALSLIVEPDMALITHVGFSHLEGLEDIDGVSVEKVSIAAGLKKHAVMICSTEHKGTLKRVRALGRNVITFGTDNDADVSGANISQVQGKIYFETNDRCQVELAMIGVHNVNNALGALAVVRRLGVTSSEYAEALKDFHAVPGRMVCADVNGITIIDDTYNANPDSMAVALRTLESQETLGRRVFVCGDMCELGVASGFYHRELGRAIAKSGVDLLLTVGEQSAQTASAALEAGMGWAGVQRSISSVRLARLIKSMIHEGDVIMVKGSRAMRMEEVVKSLKRFRRRAEPIRTSGEHKKTRAKSKK